MEDAKKPGIQQPVDGNPAASAAAEGHACSCHLPHAEIDTLEIPDEEILYDLADLFKIFGDTTRLRILFALLDTEMCVMHISERLGMTSSAISHQLKVLKDNNLVACRREGKTIFYYLADDHVHTIVAQGYEHLKEKEGTEK